ncbi:MAG: DUF1566 domain-containing protein [Sandaracinaceae bacterium]|nr:DUF1566 domain-containing protein [Sandaracinaceae bacterium]
MTLVWVVLAGCGPVMRVAEDAPPVVPDAVHAAPDSPDPGAATTVYDAAQHVYWLANANLAADPAMRAALGVSGINDDGSMSYATALEWIAALNAYDGGAGYLGHDDWQLPTNPPEDTTCAIAGGVSGNSFGPGCTGSALGGLFSTMFGAAYPEGLGLSTVSIVPLTGVPQGLFWTAGTSRADPTPWDSTNAFTFTFTSGGRGRNTTRANYFHVLPVFRGAIGAAPAGSGLVLYDAGPAAGLAIYDATNGLTWPLEATLAADQHFGVDGTDLLHFQTGTDLTVPLVAATGAMRFETSRDWLAGMNAASYAGASTWELPTVSELRGLYDQLGLAEAPQRLLTPRLAATAPHGFRDFQPFFYWACQRDQDGDARSPCNGEFPGLAPNGVDHMQWAFNFQSGFQGTDEEGKEFFVVPCYPEP